MDATALQIILVSANYVLRMQGWVSIHNIEMQYIVILVVRINE